MTNEEAKKMIDEMLEAIIADIEATRDKDKLCEYSYNRCIEIVRKAGKGE